MNQTVESFSGLSRRHAWREVMQSYLDLTKPRLTLLAVLTTLLGFYVASRGSLNSGLWMHLLFGAALVGGGANALNQFYERETDAKMKRTETRPIPSGRLSEEQAFNFGLVLSVIGVLHLAFFAHPLSSLVAVLILVSYLIFYTPLKKKTALATGVGAIPGALPPVMGWAAARGHVGLEAGILFAILFLWQLPHFLAIAWVCREDYRKAGFPLLAVADTDGTRTARHILFYCLALLPASLAPAIMGWAGPLYFCTALILGLAFLGVGLMRAWWGPALYAKRCFLASIIYLLLLSLAMMVDKPGRF